MHCRRRLDHRPQAGPTVHVMCTALLVLRSESQRDAWSCACSYMAYGPLLCGAANVIYEGVPVYPNPGRMWDIVDKLQARHAVRP